MLKPAHKKALQMLRENVMSVKDIANACNLNEDHLYHLIEGNPKAGNCAIEFQQEYKKIEKEVDLRTKKNIKTLTDRIVEELLEWNESLPKKGQLNLKQVKAKKEILAELAKVQNAVSVGEVHFHSGLTGGELIEEFKRLRSLVEFTAKRGRVPAVTTRRAGILPVPDERIFKGSEGTEAETVPSESEAGDLS